jgi:UDP-N-acetylglucosamine 2-epimerase (non-hydrolysing)
VVATGQHGDLMLPLYEHFDVRPDTQLAHLATGRRSLNELLAETMLGLQSEIGESTAAVVVQGDTTSALAGALTAFHHRVPVVHLEAGLRTHDLASPFPEEGNRRLIGQIAALHLAPTERSRAALLAEGVDPRTVVVTGNTVIDALFYTVAKAVPRRIPRQERTVLITAHRRESWGEGFDQILAGVTACALRNPTTRFVWVAHPNPVLRATVDGALHSLPNVDVLDALSYVDMVAALRACTLVLTDSGGLQEEAPSLNKPVLVMRRTTERPEAVEAGCARLVGPDAGAIEGAVSELLSSPQAYAAMSRGANPYGDGSAAPRAVVAIGELLHRARARAVRG